MTANSTQSSDRPKPLIDVGLYTQRDLIRYLVPGRFTDVSDD
jgi:hypothetical protein